MSDAETKLKILVVDDSRVILKAFTKILGEDYDIVTASDGQQAWQLLQTDPTITTVFTDMLMPELDGLGLLKLIRSAENSIIQKLPVILVTSAEDGDEEVQQAFGLGITHIVRKPFDRLLLQACAKAHVKPRHLQTDDHSASIDPTTQLANKNYFAERGKKDVAAALRHNHALSVSIIKIDEIAKLRGLIGDNLTQLLTELGSFIRVMIRQEDTLAHFGDGEYGLITSGNDTADMREQLTRIKSRISEKTFDISNQSVNVTVCMGFSAMQIGEEVSFDTLVSKANNYLANAMQSGSNVMQSASETDANNYALANVTNSIQAVLDKILVMIHKYQDHLKSAHAKTISLKMVAILTFCNQKFALGLDAELAALKAKLEK